MASSSRGQGCPGNRAAGGRLGKSRERMNKNGIEGRPGRGELAQHSEAVRPSPGDKCCRCATENRVLTWGDPVP